MGRHELTDDFRFDRVGKQHAVSLEHLLSIGRLIEDMGIMKREAVFLFLILLYQKTH